MSQNFALVDGRFVPISEEQARQEARNRSRSPSPNRSLHSPTSSFDLSCYDNGQGNCNLREALKDTSDFYFDMSDRWKDAMCSNLEKPIYPAEKEDKAERSSSPRFGLGLGMLFRRGSK